jgi:hypothetical protein
MFVTNSLILPLYDLFKLNVGGCSARHIKCYSTMNYKYQELLAFAYIHVYCA